MAITNTGAKAGVSVAAGSGRTAVGGQNASQALAREAKEKEKALVVPTAGRDPSLLDVGETALEPNLQELALQRTPRGQSRRRRHRPLPPVEMAGQKPGGPLLEKAFSTHGGATTARRKFLHMP